MQSDYVAHHFNINFIMGARVRFLPVLQVNGPHFGYLVTGQYGRFVFPNLFDTVVDVRLFFYSKCYCLKDIGGHRKKEKLSRW